MLVVAAGLLVVVALAVLVVVAIVAALGAFFAELRA
jgi:hypothetical protein